MDIEIEREERLREAYLEEQYQVGRTKRVREFNDAFRKAPGIIGPLIANGLLVITRGVAGYGNDFIDRAVGAVREFDAFTEDNDPYGEHDFGIFPLDGVSLNWKIDYYDPSMEWGSKDASDPRLTKRVLTILLADEY